MKRILKTVLLILLPASLAGQLAPVTNQYVLNPISINPACAGNRGVLNLAALYRKQWVGIKGAPETMTLAADAPVLDKKIGLGFVLMNDKIGVSKDTYINTYYSYNIPVGKGNLAFGLGAGVVMTNTAWSDLVVIDPGDELYLVDSKVFVMPSFSFGTYYSNNNYFLGFSVPKFVGYKFNYDKNKYSMTFDPKQYDFMLNTGYNFVLSPKVGFIPSTLIEYTPDKKVLFDINANLNFGNKFWVGTFYRNGRSLGGLFQFSINNQFKVAYTYGFDTGEIGGYNSGSHEIMLRYEFRYKVNVVNPLIF